MSDDMTATEVSKKMPLVVERDFSRQEDLVHLKNIKGKVTIVGCGAIGRPTALTLAHMGVPEIQIIDFDTVEQTNVTTQGFHQDEIGMTKVDAIAAEIVRIDPNIKVEVINDRWRPKYELGNIVFFCVDSILIRELMWKKMTPSTLVIDGRMLGLNLSIITAPGEDEYYNDTLFPEEEAEPGRCTAQSTIFSAYAAASFMINNFALSLKGLPIPKRADITMNAWEWTISEEEFVWQN
jgi:molybdopterin-synthase adenylyltransferase